MIPSNKIKTWWQSIDKVILFSTLFLLLIGTFLVMSSSLIHADKNFLKEQYLLKKHLYFLPLSLFIILFTTTITREKIVIICSLAFFTFVILLGAFLLYKQGSNNYYKKLYLSRYLRKSLFYN